MEIFDLSDLEQVIEQDARDAMIDVILSWARFDTFISKWVSLAFGASPDATIILMGNMDTKNKIDKLSALYAHFGLKTGAASVKRLKTAHLSFVDTRNAIAHMNCVGRQKSDPGMIVFSSMKRVKNEVGLSLIEAHPIGKMKAASAFALDACKKIEVIINKIERPISESEK